MFTDFSSNVYLGLRKILHLEQEASFNSERFTPLADYHVVNIQLCGVKAKNVLGKGEGYHTPLRNVLDILQRNYLNMCKELLLRYAFKGVQPM